ncbi:hypothetical protein H9P43_006838 [Blastocladiella emersonii ATCC 22665]|nr:hypothetical protein H9P43_006838 [Blastocladiella emersonii ATCC 22665]
MHLSSARRLFAAAAARRSTLAPLPRPPPPLLRERCLHASSLQPDVADHQRAVALTLAVLGAVRDQPLFAAALAAAAAADPDIPPRPPRPRSGNNDTDEIPALYTLYRWLRRRHATFPETDAATRLAAAGHLAPALDVLAHAGLPRRAAESWIDAHVLPFLTAFAVSGDGDPHLARRLLSHPVVTASHSPPLLVARVHATIRAFPSPNARVTAAIAGFPWPAVPVSPADLNAVLLAVMGPDPPPRTLANRPPVCAPNPAAVAALLAHVPLRRWNAATWIALARCPWVDAADLVAVYLGDGTAGVPREVLAARTFIESARAAAAVDPAPATGAVGGGADPKPLIPIHPLFARNLVVLTLLLERVVRTPDRTLSGSRAAPDPLSPTAHWGALADRLVDAARGLDWTPRFLNAVLEGYLRSGQRTKAHYLLDTLIARPDAHTLRLMLMHAPSVAHVPAILASVQERSGVAPGPFVSYWLVHACLAAPSAAGAAGAGEPDVPPPDSIAVDLTTTSTTRPDPVAAPAAREDWPTAHAILDHLLASSPTSVLPVACNLLLRSYARRGHVTRAERLVRAMRQHGKTSRETPALLMMAYAVHARTWATARYTSRFQTDQVRERGFEDVWNVHPSAVHWLLAAHPPGRAVLLRTVKLLAQLAVTLDAHHYRALWIVLLKMHARRVLTADEVRDAWYRIAWGLARDWAGQPAQVDAWIEWGATRIKIM